MTTSALARRLRSRLHGERGFTIVETVVAMVVIFGSLTALAYTATIGFRYIAYGRDRQQATAFANQMMEEIRGQAYSVITRGMSTSDLTSDARIVTCSTVRRFESCTGPKIVSSTVAGGTTVPWIIPHKGTSSSGNLNVDWATYVTNDDPAANPYSVTVIVTWDTGAISSNINNVVRLESNFWSPSGCVSSETHPFAAPCQPFFYGQATVPPGSVTFSAIELHESSVDLDEAILSFASARASLQQEQVATLTADAAESTISMESSSGLSEEGGAEAFSEGNNDPGSPTTGTAGATLNAPGAFVEALQPDAGGEIGLQLDVPAGQAGGSAVSTAAKTSDASACPPTGTRENDSLGCAGAWARQANTVTAVTPMDHAHEDLGQATVVSLSAPASNSTATAERDAVSGYDGLVDVQATRVLGTIRLGGFPTAGMSAPAGMSATAGADTNFCMRITGYNDTARVYAGERTATAPAASIGGGTFTYYDSGSGTYLSKAVTDATLSTLAFTCTRTQTVDGRSVTWRVTVASGGIAPASVPAVTNEVDTTDVQTRIEQEATVQAITVTFRFQVIVAGADEVDLTVRMDPGSLVARGVYGPPPAAG